MIQKIIDLFRKRKIFKLCKFFGTNWDGDIIDYKGATYYVDISRNILFRIKEKYIREVRKEVQ